MKIYLYRPNFKLTTPISTFPLKKPLKRRIWGKKNGTYLAPPPTNTTQIQKKKHIVTQSNNRVTNDTNIASFTTECNDFPENLTEYGADRAINVKLQRNKLKQLVQFCVQIYLDPEIHCYHWVYSLA